MAASPFGVLDGLDAIVFFGLRNGVGPPRSSRDRRGLLGATPGGGRGRDRAARTRPSFHHRDDRRGRLLRGQPPFPFLTRRPSCGGPSTAFVVYLTMNLVVLPSRRYTERACATRHRAAERPLDPHHRCGHASALFARRSRASPLARGLRAPPQHRATQVAIHLQRALSNHIAARVDGCGVGVSVTRQRRSLVITPSPSCTPGRRKYCRT